MAFRYLVPIPPQAPLVTFTVFRYPPRSRFWALAQMGRPVVDFRKVAGLTFRKLMGSGRAGFSPLPDFSQYVLLAVWETNQAADAFFASAAFDPYRQQTDELWTVKLRATQAHGQWDGRQPFPVTENPYLDLPVVVLTRATIRPGALIDFWRHVPLVNRRIAQADGLLFTMGIGEKPVVQQATVSIWQSLKHVQQFAYVQPEHKQVVQRTRKRNWYKEELFARFVPVATEGTLGGQDVLEAASYLTYRS